MYTKNRFLFYLKCTDYTRVTRLPFFQEYFFPAGNLLCQNLKAPGPISLSFSKFVVLSCGEKKRKKNLMLKLDSSLCGTGRIEFQRNHTRDIWEMFSSWCLSDEKRDAISRAGGSPIDVRKKMTLLFHDPSFPSSMNASSDLPSQQQWWNVQLLLYFFSLNRKQHVVKGEENLFSCLTPLKTHIARPCLSGVQNASRFSPLSSL